MKWSVKYILVCLTCSDDELQSILEGGGGDGRGVLLAMILNRVFGDHFKSIVKTDVLF